MTIHNQNSKGPQKALRSFQDLKHLADGNWGYVLGHLAPELSDAMGQLGHHGVCPVHGGSDGFRLFKDFGQTGGGTCNTCGAKSNGFAMLSWIRDCSYGDAVKEIGQFFDGETSNPTPRPPPPPPVDPIVDYTRALESIRRVWGSSQPLAGTAGERYLLNRGILVPDHPTELRFHPSLAYMEKTKEGYEVTGRYPAILAPVKDVEGRIVTIHRVYLTAQGDKAPVSEVKKMMSICAPVQGTSVHLGRPAKVMGAAEGLETAAAAAAISRMPVWSAVNATLLEQMEFPSICEHVVVWADLDRSERGAEAAKALAERVAATGRTVEICMPEGPIPESAKGVDWLDVLKTKGILGFPEQWRRWEEPRRFRQAA